jgi:hypothetical protein
MTWIIHFEPIETITQMFHIAFINIYILKCTQQLNTSLLYLNTLKISHLFNYQHLHMSWMNHFECLKSIIHKLHFARY